MEGRGIADTSKVRLNMSQAISVLGSADSARATVELELDSKFSSSTSAFNVDQSTKNDLSSFPDVIVNSLLENGFRTVSACMVHEEYLPRISMMCNHLEAKKRSRELTTSKI